MFVQKGLNTVTLKRTSLVQRKNFNVVLPVHEKFNEVFVLIKGLFIFLLTIL